MICMWIFQHQRGFRENKNKLFVHWSSDLRKLASTWFHCLITHHPPFAGGHTSGSLHHAHSPHIENPLPHLASRSRKRSVYMCHQLWELRYLRVCRLLLASMCSLPSNPSFLQNVIDNFHNAWVWLPLIMFQQNKLSGHSFQGRIPLSTTLGPEPPKLFQQDIRTSSKAPNLWFRSGEGCT